MMRPRVMFTLIIGKVFHPGVPLKRIHILYIFFTSPKISHFHCSRLLSFDGVVCNAHGRCISQCTGILGCLCPRSFKVSLKIIPSWQFRNNAPNSASAADATTNHSIAHNVWNAPLSFMGFPSIGTSPMKKCPHTLLRALGLLKYKASEWMFMTMPNARNRTFAFGCDAK